MRKPVHHIVRIVVVPPRRGSRSVSQGSGHGLSKGQLKAAENALTKMSAPSSPGGKSAPGSSAAKSPKPKSMFEALESTDIVVVGTEPASVCLVDDSGKPVSPESPKVKAKTLIRKLLNHDEANRYAVLRVWTDSDTIEYQCDEPFEIVRVEKAGWKIDGTLDDPFGNSENGYRAHKENAEGEEEVWVWRSGLLPAAANNQQYKATFKIGGKLIDPDVVCGSPPPSP